jgi:DNA polymerase (family 10)
MKNKEIAAIFLTMADLLELVGEDRFRINSYRKAGRTIEELPRAIEDAAAAGELEDIPGIGKSTAEKIGEYLKTGKIARHEELLAKVPAKLPELLGVPGLGPKTTAKLWKQADIKSIAELEHAIENEPDRLIEIEGMGPKKIRQIWEAMAYMKNVGGRMPLGEATIVAGDLVEAVKKIKGATRVMPAGSLRRGRETVGDIDVLCEAAESAAPKIIEAFTQLPFVKHVLAKGDTKGSVMLAFGEPARAQREAQADLRVVPKEGYGAALMYFTGSKAHNVRLREIAIKKKLKLNEYGLFKGDQAVAGTDEEGIYKALGLEFIPPEIREDSGEIDLAAKGQLPKLVELADIRGDLHMHTDESDGISTLDEMIAACRDRGYKYMAICDHSKTQIQAHGLDEKRLRSQIDAIHKAAKKFADIEVFAGSEVDIFKDGHLDFEADVLAELDFVVASPHSALSMGREETTKRLIRAIEQPGVCVIGHPSGRMINSRPGLELDIDAVAHAAAANGVALEINSQPVRLDLRDTHVRAAIKAGAKIIISTDAHNTNELDLMRFGITTARRGWATPADIVNTMPLAEFKKWMKKKK